MHPHTRLVNECLVALSELGNLSWRNETGAGYTGTLVQRDTNLITLRDAYYIRYGLCPGSSDIISITPVTITQDMVGQTIGQFTAVECKTGNARLNKDQQKFFTWVKGKGGRCITARTADDVRETRT